ncbi:hypothetical protein IU500_13515 [Nocardia terpenica]|uniref:hypothetical protein n=1 Tax=Nocardia terpenica TaxID=455432 RepID=UPI001892F2D5|nr:hypothetical protein [Nocardia terpenica]MBF6062804.1 hypothetical protein [Nocardia terpenica]MBF6105061.1 hypothetical protein [Nocardia terpenica]MBF6112502.1 hypothetical protein [Nocardia terpenica]MBF6118789.1 hypothetical protein [Nocardia terpenica]MBF6154258.1 hypothetical protein [Nocardia terpenica]
MADSTTPPQRPLEGLINDAKEGRLTVNFNQDVRVDAEEFAYIERDCQAFKDSIRNIQQIAKEISSQKKWGLGEDQAILTSAQTLVHRFRAKAAIVTSGKDSANNVNDILEDHYRIVDDLQELHRTIAQKFVETDQEFAARYNELKANMPPSSISAAPVQGPIRQSDGKWR